ncbi:CTP synthase [Desulfurispirillum indicum]|uniref:CTP synthase n=1 Tax=Desulfurispirillum indicum (strain ATCC BAA-1389 / DSM 22839 / S5) TaxID=653733 RepID=E6W4H4_DESIS|nr:CTP synthase [Desulfurispirillum indicum]ADU67047.1 CTP synthase [Desulfurispirillum indicum S5]UCZ56278.1 CTP synthase [Desulfurispirillum indicum]
MSNFTQKKYIFITGGVLSSLGKGLAAASIGALLEARGYRVKLQKFDPYLNIDPGTMSPYQHGEVFVTDDGAETDLDLGHYERFVNMTTNRYSNITTGQVYNNVITKERRGDYLGGTVQVIPHITDEIKRHIYLGNEDADIIMTEIGGTVGDIESLPFLEAIRQFAYDVGRENVCYMHLTLVPYMAASGELKTKPTQHSVKELREIGIQPDVLFCRTEYPLSYDIREKIALFCNVKPKRVIEAIDVDTIYRVPLQFYNEKADEAVLDVLGLEYNQADLSEWQRIVDRSINPSEETTIGVVGKYAKLKEAYKSLSESIGHAGIENDIRVNIKWIDAEEVTRQGAATLLQDVDGILVPGGFGDRGVEGKIQAIRYAREKKVPFFGICLGMQCAVIEYARNVLGIQEATSIEFDSEARHPVIDFMADQKNLTNLGGTMRLGKYDCRLQPDTLSHKAYGQELVSERHRHRLEFNNKYRDELQKAGLVISGTSPDDTLVEIVEVPNHPWFVACQFHPEFKSRPSKAHPLFREFIKASVKSGKLFKEE